jgi:predicted MPP superfamily phosphohydrolase
MNRRDFLKASALTAGLTLVPFFADLLAERYLVQVNRYRIPVPNLPQEFNGFTIVHLTDLHYGIASESFVRNIVNKVNSLKRDVIVCTGDFVHHRDTVREINGVWPILSELQAPSGVYSVLGNHDHWAGKDRSFYWLHRTGQYLRHEICSIKRGGKRLWIAGGGDLWSDHLNFDNILGDVPRKDCRIVLAHNPDSADTAFSERVDLIISGHTHGGQVYIPFYGTPPFMPVNNMNYNFGLKTNEKGTPIFISKGVGCGAFPIRFNCPPEIAVLELVNSREIT